MASTYKKGDVVKVRAVIPSGPVLALRMDEDGVVYCLLEWEDQDGNVQQRWFREDDLVAA